MFQLAETSSGGSRQYGNGIRHAMHAEGLRLMNSRSRIAYSCAAVMVVRDTFRFQCRRPPFEQVRARAVRDTARSGYHAMPMRLAALLFFAALAFPALAEPQTPRSLFLEELTWTELRDAIASGKTTVIVPIGGTEQNGPHIALGKHNERVAALASRIADGLGDALVAPVLAYVPEGPVSPPSGHMKFPGTITIPEAAFEQILVSAGRSFRLHGFRDVVFIGDHGGYQQSMKKAADTLNREWAGKKIRAHAIGEYYRASSAEFAAALEKKGFSREEIGSHAGLADTSLMLATHPEYVRTDRMGNGSKAEGVDGDPRLAAADLGKLGVDLIVSRTVDAIRKATARR